MSIQFSSFRSPGGSRSRRETVHPSLSACPMPIVADVIGREGFPAVTHIDQAGTII